MNTMRNFFWNSDIILRAGKTNMLVSNKQRRDDKEKQLRGSKVIEEVDNFEYLEFVFKERNFKNHLAELKRMAAIDVRKTRGLRESECNENL